MENPMHAVTAKEARLRFGRLLDTAQREPVTITKNGRPVALVIAMESPAVVRAVQEAIDDHSWGEMAVRADAEGYLSPEESEKFLSACLNA